MGMGFLHLFIVNKAGGLIFHRPLGPKAPQIGTNEWLRIGSTFHSLHAICAEASPLKLPGNKNACESGTGACFPSPRPRGLMSPRARCCDAAGADDGIEEIQGGGLLLKCLQTRTGIKFVLT